MIKKLKIIIPAVLFIGIGIISILWLGKTDTENNNRMNVILITIDTIRADYVSAYKNRGKNHTPVLDKLASQGVLFEHSITQTPLTLPAHTSILSGTYPFYHQVRDNGGFLVPPSLKLISEVFKENKYSTSAFIGAFVLHSKWGLNQGFDEYSDNFNLSSLNSTTIRDIQFRADKVLNNAKKWIEKNANNKFFTWIHLYDPHYPYSAPEPYYSQYSDDNYMGEIAYTDAMIGDFFEFLKTKKLYDNSLIIVTGDHGEGLDDHDEDQHGYFIYETTIHVPTIIKGPQDFKTKRVQGTVEHVDLMPTILDLVDLPVPKEVQGRSLKNLMNGAKPSTTRLAYTETYYPRYHYGWSDLKAVYLNGLKYILSPKAELFNLTTDYEERHNIHRENYVNSKKLKEKLTDFLKTTGKNSISPIKNTNLDAADIERLKALGYLSTTVDTKNAINLPDPKVKLPILNKMFEAKRLSETPELDKAEKMIDEVIQKDPQIIDAHFIRGNLQIKKKDFNKALESFNKVLELKPQYNAAMGNIIKIHIELKKYLEGIKKTKEFLKLFPEDYVLLQHLGDLYVKTGDLQNAKTYLEKSLSLNHYDTKTLSLLGLVYLNYQNPDKVKNIIAQIKKIDPDHLSLSYLQSKVLSINDNVDTNIKNLSEQAGQDPNNARVFFNLGNNLLKKGDFNQAYSSYIKAFQINSKIKNLGYLISTILSKNGNHVKAIEFLLHEAKHFNSATIQYNLANEYYYLKKFDKAINCYKNAIKLKPDYMEANINLSIVLEDVKQNDEAITYLKEFLRNKTDDIEALGRLGELYTKTDKKKALEYFDRALKLAEEKGKTDLIQQLNYYRAKVN